MAVSLQLTFALAAAGGLQDAHPRTEPTEILSFEVGSDINPGGASVEWAPTGMPIQLRLSWTPPGVGAPGLAASIIFAPGPTDVVDEGNTFYDGPHGPGDNPFDEQPDLPTIPTNEGGGETGNRPTLGILTVDGETVFLTSDSNKGRDPGDPGRPSEDGKKPPQKGPGIDVLPDVLDDVPDNELDDEVFPPAPKPGGGTTKGYTLKEVLEVVSKHTEGHAGGVIRGSGDDGTVVINRPPCGFCKKGVPYFLDEGQILIVRYPRDPTDPDSPFDEGYFEGGKPGFNPGLPPGR